jgi:hypothetical protein
MQKPQVDQEGFGSNFFYTPSVLRGTRVIQRGTLEHMEPGGTSGTRNGMNL